MVSCQEGNLNDNLQSIRQPIKQAYSKEYIKFDALLSKNNLVSNKVNSFKTKNLVSSSIHDFNFVEKDVLYIDGDSFDQYTFPIVRDTINPYYIENYVLKENDNGEINQYLIKYKKTQQNYSYESIEIINDSSIITFSCFPVLVDVVSVGYNCVQVDDNQGQNVGCGADEENCNSTHEECESYDTLFIFEGSCGGSSSDGGGGGSSSGVGSSDPGSTTPGGGNSDNNNSATIDHNDVIGDPIEPELIPKLPVMEYFENLDDDKKDCYENSGLNNMGTGNGKGLNPTSMIEDIEAFLNENTTNGVIDPEAQAFADAILEDCDSGQEVDFEIRNINKLTNLCAKNIFSNLEDGIYKEDVIKPEITLSLNGFQSIDLNFSEHILSLFNNSDFFNYIIKMKVFKTQMQSQLVQKLH